VPAWGVHLAGGPACYNLPSSSALRSLVNCKGPSNRPDRQWKSPNFHGNSTARPHPPRPPLIHTRRSNPATYTYTRTYYIPAVAPACSPIHHLTVGAGWWRRQGHGLDAPRSGHLNSLPLWSGWWCVLTTSIGRDGALIGPPVVARSESTTTTKQRLWPGETKHAREGSTAASRRLAGCDGTPSRCQSAAPIHPPEGHLKRWRRARFRPVLGRPTRMGIPSGPRLTAGPKTLRRRSRSV